jgi:hypothetical protein
LRTYAEERRNGLDVGIEDFCAATAQLLYVLGPELRAAFVHFDNEDPAEAARQEFIQMTGQIGEILATLVFQQIRGCGAFVQTKIDLDNPNMPRHGEDLLAFMFDPSSPEKDELFFVEAKSSKASISAAVEEIRNRFASHLQKLPIYEVVRLKRHITEKIGDDQAGKVRMRISDLLWSAKIDPGHSRVRFSPFLHYPAEYHPQDTTLKRLGDIKINGGDDEIRAAPSQIHVIVFQFADFEETVREIFRKAWTI